MPKQGQTRRPYYSTNPWQCRHGKETSEITAYVEASGKWETVLTVHPTSGASAEVMARYLVAIMNDVPNLKRTLNFALDTIKVIHADGGKLTFSSEQDAERLATELEQISYKLFGT